MRMLSMRTRILLLILAAAAIAVYVLFSTGVSLKDKSGDVRDIPEQAIEKFTVSETEAGKPKWVLEAASAQIVDKQKRALLQSPVIKFYENGVYVSTLVSERGRINMENYDIVGEGKCTLDTVKGERLETSNLSYQSAAKLITTPEKVKLIRPSEIVYGTGMEATPDLSTIKIRKQRVEVRPQVKQP